MPRGEHFKKDNPRINQVSFKVNDNELVELKEIAKKANQSVAEWLRGQISVPNTAQPIVAKVIESVKEEQPKAEQPKVEVVKPVSVAKKEKPVAKNEQMSMF